MVELCMYSEDKTTVVNALDEEGRETEKYTHAHKHTHRVKNKFKSFVTIFIFGLFILLCILFF